LTDGDGDPVRFAQPGFCFNAEQARVLDMPDADLDAEFGDAYGILVG